MIIKITRFRTLVVALFVTASSSGHSAIAQGATGEQRLITCKFKQFNKNAKVIPNTEVRPMSLFFVSPISGEGAIDPTTIRLVDKSHLLDATPIISGKSIRLVKSKKTPTEPSIKFDMRPASGSARQLCLDPVGAQRGLYFAKIMYLDKRQGPVLEGMFGALCGQSNSSDLNAEFELLSK